MSQGPSPDLIVGVVGAGSMGRGIAQLCVQAGYRVLLFDTSVEQMAAARDFIGKMLVRAAEKGTMSAEEAAAAIARLEPVAGIDHLAPCGLVIEAAIEDLDIKQELFARLEAVVDDACVLATNTSSLSVTAVAARCRRPERVAGFHFFMPAPLMRLIEVIDGVRTSPGTIDLLMAAAQRIGHTAVRVADSPGFLVNHAGRGYLTESLAVLGEGVAAPADIDRIMLAAGFRMGPFQLMDLTGIDVTHPAMESVHQGFYGDPRFRPSGIVRRRLQAGLIGRKSGAGWYDYAEGAQGGPAAEPPAPADRPARVWVAPSEPARRAALLAAVERCGGVIDDGRFPAGDALCLLAPLGSDATTATLALGVDPRRAVAIDTLLPLDKRRTIMGTPVTDPGALRAAHGLLAADGVPVTVIRDSAGFVAQHVLAMVVNTACDIAQQRIATPADIDRAVRLGLGYPQGPLAWGDILGPARVLALLDAMHAFNRDPRYRPSPWLTRRARLGVSLLTSEP